jgi:[amino group carrier protein]-L-2-aminoadipate/L-glutamate 6-kinase
MILIKIGGGSQLNLPAIAQDIKELSLKEQIVVVHGANAERDKLAKKLGRATRYLTSPSGHQGVYTDQQAIDVMLMAYSGLVNKKIVALFRSNGINALGLSGIDGGLWQGERKKHLYSVENGKTKLITDTFTGKVTQVNANLIHLLLDNQYLPVITQAAISEGGEIINTDNDRNIAVMVKSLKIKTVISLFEAPGLLRKYPDERSLIKTINKKKLDDYLPYCQGRMKKKLMGAKEAFTAGLKKMYWADGRIEQPILKTLDGQGTIIS